MKIDLVLNKYTASYNGSNPSIICTFNIYDTLHIYGWYEAEFIGSWKIKKLHKLRISVDDTVLELTKNPTPEQTLTIENLLRNTDYDRLIHDSLHNTET